MLEIKRKLHQGRSSSHWEVDGESEERKQVEVWRSKTRDIPQKEEGSRKTAGVDWGLRKERNNNPGPDYKRKRVKVERKRGAGSVNFRRNNAPIATSKWEGESKDIGRRAENLRKCASWEEESDCVYERTTTNRVDHSNGRGALTNYILIKINQSVLRREDFVIALIISGDLNISIST